ncbi:Uncharacterized protein TCM_002778 [Theobroma cacao]|uniref:Uncharacterized protein n=1 Tax=Theobroma cacao TaxID=3641 RepID=A0A061DV04_THECC|nr:Uncharacterized protein TCM_002778 [Theobroma cacao]
MVIPDFDGACGFSFFACGCIGFFPWAFVGNVAGSWDKDSFTSKDSLVSFLFLRLSSFSFEALSFLYRSKEDGSFDTGGISRQVSNGILGTLEARVDRDKRFFLSKDGIFFVS